ncbi:MAG: hypothetical protein Kow0068_08620 [Marinilabiliales bacterium]
MKRKIKYLIVLLSFSVTVYAQQNSVKKYFRQNLILADEFFQAENYAGALKIYNDLYAIDSLNIEVNYKLGVCMFNIYRKKTDLIKYFERSKVEYPESYYYLGRIYHLRMQFNKALENYNKYKNSGKALIVSVDDLDFEMDKCYVAKKMIISPVDVEIVNAGDKINTSYPEYVPLVTGDESVMYFTSRRPGSTGDKLDPNGEYFEDIYYSEYIDSAWSDVKQLGAPVNTPTHDACVALSIDGNKMLIYRTDWALTGGDIYETEFINGEWTKPVKLTDKINSKEGAETSAVYSPDQQTIYFSSNRPGGYGGKDIYRIKKMPDNTWSLPMNLGPVINTKYDEDAPFMHPDGVTLYFSSKGHKNMGGYDIFKSVKQENGWTTPENLGYPINTVGDDIYFTLSVDGSHGYYSSDMHDTYGSSDIFIINMPKEENKYVILKGTVVSYDDGFKKLPAVITVIDYITKELHGIYRTNSKTGKYLMVLQPRRKYKIIVESEGYHVLIDEIDMREKLRLEDLLKNIALKKIKPVSDKINNEEDSENSEIDE